MSAQGALATVVPAAMRAVWAASMILLGSVAAMLARASFRVVRFHVSRFSSAQAIRPQLVAAMRSIVCAATRLRIV